MNHAVIALVLLVVASTVQARGLEAHDFFLIERGMAEDQVRAKLGKPDHNLRVACGARKGHKGAHQWLYLPAANTADPQLSVITFENGVVSSVERLRQAAHVARRHALDEETVHRLSRGMSEAEVIARAGLPQRHASAGCEHGGAREAKAKLYYPSAQGTMVITVLGGKVSDIEQLSARRSR